MEQNTLESIPVSAQSSVFHHEKQRKCSVLLIRKYRNECLNYTECFHHCIIKHQALKITLLVIMMSSGAARDPFAHLSRVFSWSRLLEPPLSRAVFFLWWVPRSGMGSLLNFGFSLEPCHLRFFLNLRLLFLAVLE